MNKKINKCGCGGNTILEIEIHGANRNYPYSITCLECGFSSSHYSTEEETVKLWNMAHPEISNAMSQFVCVGVDEKYRLIYEKEEYFIEEINALNVNCSHISGIGGKSLSRKKISECEWRIYEN